MSAVDPKGGVAPCTTRVMNLANFLSQSARRNPGEPGFVWGDTVWTWAQMEARVNAMAHALRHEYGVTKGDRILVQSANCNQMFESMFACFRLGAVSRGDALLRAASPADTFGGYFSQGDWHDTYLSVDEASSVRFQTDRFTGRMVVHCHILEHEDEVPL